MSSASDPLATPGRDDLILELRDPLGATVVMVPRELASIFATANHSVVLDAEAGSQLAAGEPRRLLADPPEPKIRESLTRGEQEALRAR
jgi:phospholipid/cholesterol/gamma-HCH transport system ATP-binding protein